MNGRLAGPRRRVHAAEGQDPREAAARTALAIGCARLGGATADQVKDRIRKELTPAELAKACAYTPSQVAGTAEVTPPLTVPQLACRRR